MLHWKTIEVGSLSRFQFIHNLPSYLTSIGFALPFNSPNSRILPSPTPFTVSSLPWHHPHWVPAQNALPTSSSLHHHFSIFHHSRHSHLLPSLIPLSNVLYIFQKHLFISHEIIPQSLSPSPIPHSFRNVNWRVPHSSLCPVLVICILSLFCCYSSKALIIPNSSLHHSLSFLFCSPHTSHCTVHIFHWYTPSQYLWTFPTPSPHIPTSQNFMFSTQTLLHVTPILHSHSTHLLHILGTSPSTYNLKSIFHQEMVRHSFTFTSTWLHNLWVTMLNTSTSCHSLFLPQFSPTSIKFYERLLYGHIVSNHQLLVSTYHQ